MAAKEISTELLADIKAYLNITWHDSVTMNKLQNFIRNGIAYLNDKLGAEGDYMSPGYPRSLLFDYVRYARDEATDVFEENYKHLILAMQNERAVNAYVEKNAVSPEE